LIMNGVKFKTIKLIVLSLAAIEVFLIFGCEKLAGLKKPKPHSAAIFDETWNLIDRQYALFAVKDINWQNIYDEYRLRLKDGMTDNELFSLTGSMLATLKDGHVTLISLSDTTTYENFYKPFPRNFNYDNILKYYLKNEYSISGPLIYKIDNGVGYIYYSSFQQDISGEQIDKVLKEMEGTKGLIVDVRDNTGGKSANVDEFFKRFIKERKLVKYEAAKKGPGHNDFFEPEVYYISPAGNYYGKPVCVLTNRVCFSACNDFVLYMSGLDNVKIIGDQTGGGGGIPYDYVLANGWKIQYTATATLSPQKVAIENGILPAIDTQITPFDESNGKDPIIEKAFSLLQ
jgi:Peptidase family S41/Tricorn protease C1 domain